MSARARKLLEVKSMERGLLAVTWQLSTVLTPVPGNPMPSVNLLGTACQWCTDIHAVKLLYP